ncbi:MAG TPA: IS1380 family transposase, partial [Solirubrobacterales bacterium]|nr:IS1380 family transposase [Solirubrobacterales bacterium]
ANAGLVLVATLSIRLGIESLVDKTVRLGQRAGAAQPGRKVLTLIHAIAAGADSIDDTEVLRGGGTEALLGHRAMAPSTLGTFLRAFTFGHVRQLDRVLGEAIKRAWAAGAGPGAGRLVIDIDSFLGEAKGRLKQGASFGYTGVRGYHPLLATRAGTGEVLHCRLRKGAANSGRGALRFCEELIARMRRAGATGEILIRADSAFHSLKVISYLEAKGCLYSIAVKQHKPIAELIASIPESAWRPVPDYPETGVCELAETTYGDRRLIVRRVHLHAQDEQTELFAYWRHFAFLTNREEDMHTVDVEHRQHAEVELCIRDLKDQALAHFPSGQFNANAAWTVIACLAHNLGRWVGQLGLEDSTWRTAATIRRWLITLPGRLTRTARRWTLHLPARWPWREAFVEALSRIRALPAAA